MLCYSRLQNMNEEAINKGKKCKHIIWVIVWRKNKGSEINRQLSWPAWSPRWQEPDNAAPIAMTMAIPRSLGVATLCSSSSCSRSIRSRRGPGCSALLCAEVGMSADNTNSSADIHYVSHQYAAQQKMMNAIIRGETYTWRHCNNMFYFLQLTVSAGHFVTGFITLPRKPAWILQVIATLTRMPHILPPLFLSFERCLYPDFSL